MIPSSVFRLHCCFWRRRRSSQLRSGRPGLRAKGYGLGPGSQARANSQLWFQTVRYSACSLRLPAGSVVSTLGTTAPCLEWTPASWSMSSQISRCKPICAYFGEKIPQQPPNPTSRKALAVPNSCSKMMTEARLLSLSLSLSLSPSLSLFVKLSLFLLLSLSLSLARSLRLPLSLAPSGSLSPSLSLSL